MYRGYTFRENKQNLGEILDILRRSKNSKKLPIIGLTSLKFLHINYRIWLQRKVLWYFLRYEKLRILEFLSNLLFQNEANFDIVFLNSRQILTVYFQCIWRRKRKWGMRFEKRKLTSFPLKSEVWRIWKKFRNTSNWVKLVC